MANLRCYRADLHLHTVLSPCGDLEMSPKKLLSKAKEKGLDLIAITDHNIFDNAPAYKKVASEFGIEMLYGVEIQTSEEVHIIALFDNWTNANKLNKLIYDALLPINNDPDYFGDQVVVDEHENIIRFEEKALINSVIWTVDETVQLIKKHHGFCFPAHVDAKTYSIISQLGYIPEEAGFLAVGITAKGDLEKILKKFPYLQHYAIIRNSDAHYLKDIGSGFSEFYIEKVSIDEIIKACKNQDGRKIKVS